MATITVLDSAGTIQTVAKVANTGVTSSSASLPVTIASDDIIHGPVNETAPGSDTGSSGINGRLQRIAQRLTSLIAVFPTLVSGRMPVDGSGVTQPVSIASAAPLSTGASTSALQGALTETAPASDTASSGLNGRLQRVAQNLTTLNTTLSSANSQLPTALGENSRAASLSVVDAPSGYTSKVSLTRTADTSAYTAGDVLGSATGSTAALTFSGVAPGASPIMITTAELEIDASAVISGETSYRLYLYNVTPPSALGDNAAWDLPSGDRNSFLGYVDLSTPVDLGSTLYVQTLAINKQVKTASSSIYGYLTTIGAYTPTSARVHAITLHTVTL